MARREKEDSVIGNVLHAFGKGCLIACAGMVIGALFGSPALTTASAWGLFTMTTLAAAGLTCMYGAAAFHRSCWEHNAANETNSACAPGRTQPAQAMSVATFGGVQPLSDRAPDDGMEDVTEEDRAVTRFVQQVEAERELAEKSQRVH